MGQFRNRILLVLAVLAAAFYFTFPIQKHINLGLDLKGGMHLVLLVETDKLDENAKSDVVKRAIEIIRNRIDSMGAAEPIIVQQGENQIIVQLPGITDRDAAINLIGMVAQLEFRVVEDNINLLKQALEGTVPAGYVLKKTKENDEPLLLEDKIALSGETVVDARVDFNDQGFNQPYISMTFNDQGASAFGIITKNNVGKRLAIIMDGEVLSAPNINEAILGGNAQITGQFTYEEANVLALSLRSGALPAPMRIEEERTIGPLLGKDSIEAGINATITGGVILFIFMLFYYLTAGVIADIALSFNLLLIFGIMGFFNAMMPQAQMTLTLPGIAGIILTLGMAVDANVLINERIREELSNGRPIRAAISNGFSKALAAIIDSNVTTLMAAFMLFQFGSGPIKGFAVTLTIGLLSSVFTAVFVSRLLFELSVHFNIIKDKLPMLKIFENTKFDFFKYKYFCFALSAILIIGSFVALYTKKDAAYGIDFAGGQVQEYKFSKPIESDAIRSVLKNNGIEDAIIQRFDDYPENVLVRTSKDTYTQASTVLTKEFPDNSFEVLRIEKVGPVVGKTLRKAALLAFIFALGAILIYVGFRFKHFDFAAAGVIALLHDIFVTIGVILLLGRQIDLLVITALLTIAGYSINDTIVIYDRVRENLGKSKHYKLKEIINLSLNQTLGRTVLTTSATLLVVFALFFKGGEILNTFALCLIVGFIAGTYSTVFIVSPLVLMWQKKSR